MLHAAPWLKRRHELRGVGAERRERHGRGGPLRGAKGHAPSAGAAESGRQGAGCGRGDGERRGSRRLACGLSLVVLGVEPGEGKI